MSLSKLTGIVIDTETGGLDERRCALLEVALIAVREGGIVAKWHTRVIPYPGLDIEWDAARVNGYTPEGWGGAAERDVMLGLLEFVQWFLTTLKRKKITWIGSNNGFDRLFLREAARRHQCATELMKCFDHRDVDLTKIAMVPYLMGKLPGVGVDVLLRDLLGRENRGVHSALADCEAELDCLQALLSRLVWV